MAVGAIFPVCGLIENSLSTRQKWLMAAHMFDFVPGVAHHTGRINSFLRVHDFRRSEVTFVTAVSVGLTVTSFAPYARSFMSIGEFFVAESVMAHTAKRISDKSFSFVLFLRGLLFGLLQCRVVRGIFFK